MLVCVLYPADGDGWFSSCCPRLHAPVISAGRTPICRAVRVVSCEIETDGTKLQRCTLIVVAVVLGTHRLLDQNKHTPKSTHTRPHQPHVQISAYACTHEATHEHA